MNFPQSRSECPKDESWLRLLGEAESAHDRDALESHLSSCGPCRDRLETLAAEGKLETDDDGRSISPATMDILARWFRTSPTVKAQEPAVEPDPVPTIPGFDDFQVVSRGGMGIVFRAREVELDRPVAIKVLSIGGRFSASSRARAVREALVMASLRHPNVVSVYRSGELDGSPYLVMEWVAGGTLQARIDQETYKPREAARIVQSLASAVAEAHALGIIHRDLKPDNVLLVPSADPDPGFVPKLTDFGLARRGDNDRVTETGMILGTPGYMAPEQTGLDAQFGEVGPATDLHGLGAILFACLIGKAPYAGESSWESLVRSARSGPSLIRKLRPDIPRDLATIVETCLQPSPLRRYRSAADLADDLRCYLEGRPILARPISAPERFAMWARRHPAIAAAVALLIIASIAGILGTIYHVRSINRALRDVAAERDRTGQTLDQARRMLATLSDDVVQRLVQRGQALDEADRTFLRKVRSFYDEWPLEPDPLASLKFRASGLSRVGDIFQSIDHYDDAVTCRSRAIAAYDDAIHRGFDLVELKEARCETLFKLLDLLVKSNRWNEAETSAGKVIETRRSLGISAQADWLTLAKAYRYLGWILGKQPNRFEEAEAAFAEGLAIYDRYRGRKPVDPIVPTNEESDWYSRGWIELLNGREALAEASFRRLLELAEISCAAFPEDIELQIRRNMGLEMMAVTFEEKRKPQSHEAQRKRMEFGRALLAKHPTNLRCLTEYALITADFVKLCIELGRPEEAEVDLNRAIAEAQKMVDAEPAVYDRFRTLHMLYDSRTLLLKSTGRMREAVAQYDRTMKSLKPWSRLQGREIEVTSALIYAGTRVAELLMNLGEPHESADRLISIIEFLPSHERPAYYLDASRRYLASGDSQAARTAAEKAAENPGYAEEAAKVLSQVAR